MDPDLKRRSQPKWIKDNIVIFRAKAGEFGAIRCRTCHLPALTQRELADAIGVKLTAMADFLHGRMVRPDVGAKIRAAVYDVVAE